MFHHYIIEFLIPATAPIPVRLTFIVGVVSSVLPLFTTVPVIVPTLSVTDILGAVGAVVSRVNDTALLSDSIPKGWYVGLLTLWCLG